VRQDDPTHASAGCHPFVRGGRKPAISRRQLRRSPKDPLMAIEGRLPQRAIGGTTIMHVNLELAIASRCATCGDFRGLAPRTPLEPATRPVNRFTPVVYTRSRKEGSIGPVITRTGRARSESRTFESPDPGCKA
jgi:hypothetical protein